MKIRDPKECKFDLVSLGEFRMTDQINYLNFVSTGQMSVTNLAQIGNRGG